MKQDFLVLYSWNFHILQKLYNCKEKSERNPSNQDGRHWFHSKDYGGTFKKERKKINVRLFLSEFGTRSIVKNIYDFVR